MTTPIGQAFAGFPLRLTVAALVGTAVVVCDLVVMQLGRSEDADALWRPMPAILALGVFLALARGDRTTVGLTLVPLRGYWYWCKATLLLGAVVGAFCAIVIFLCWFLGWSIPIPALPPSRFGSSLVRSCIEAPLIEEAIYRLALCIPLAALVRPAWTIVVSGVAFALLHFVYGNPGPDNFIAGYLFAWAFLKSGTIIVPVALHSLGNLCALIIQLVFWYWS